MPRTKISDLVFMPLYFHLTPASAAVHAGAVCMIKCEVRTFMQTDTACAVGCTHLLCARYSIKILISDYCSVYTNSSTDLTTILVPVGAVKSNQISGNSS